jgi:hypothetical protein
MVGAPTRLGRPPDADRGSCGQWKRIARWTTRDDQEGRRHWGRWRPWSQRDCPRCAQHRWSDDGRKKERSGERREAVVPIWRFRRGGRAAPLQTATPDSQSKCSRATSASATSSNASALAAAEATLLVSYPRGPFRHLNLQHVVNCNYGTLERN